MSIDPIYVDGPLAGQRYDVDSYRVHFSMFQSEDVVYRIERFRLTLGDDSFDMHLAYCSQGRPSAEAIMSALVKPEVMQQLHHSVAGLKELWWNSR